MDFDPSVKVSAVVPAMGDTGSDLGWCYKVGVGALNEACPKPESLEGKLHGPKLELPVLQSASRAKRVSVNAYTNSPPSTYTSVLSPLAPLS